MGIESSWRKIINHNFVQGQRNQPSCQRFAIFDTQVDFPTIPVQSLGRFLYSLALQLTQKQEALRSILLSRISLFTSYD